MRAYSPRVVLLTLAMSCGGEVVGVVPSGSADAGGSPPVGRDGGVIITPPPPPPPPRGRDSGIVTPPTRKDSGIFVPDASPPPPLPDSSVPPVCVPNNCIQAGATCGVTGDGCGGVIACGSCTPPEACGGAGVPNQCAPFEGSPDAGSSSPAGMWTGMWQANEVAAAGVLTMDLTLHGSAVTGSVAFEGEPCFSSAMLAGTFSPPSVAGTVVSGANQGALQAELTGNTLTGKLVVTAGGCAMVTGTFTATR